MAARVLRVDLLKPLEPLRTSKRYAAYWVLITFGRSPIGWVKFRRTGVGDVVTPDMLRGLIAEQCGPMFVDAVHQRRHELARDNTDLGISVVICTREHPNQLRRQLKAVTSLNYPKYEVIVIDNAPRTDGTRQVCREFAGRLRYIVEPHKGLDYARNAGWRAARYPIVSYTDDDACVDPDWLSAIAENFADPAVGCVTGNTFPYELEHPAQELFERYGGMQRGFHRRVYRPGPWSPYHPLGSGRFGAGVNMSLRRDVLEKMGGFDNALDVGSLSRGGGDLDIMTRVIRDGWTLVHEPSAMVWHQHRRTMPELRKQMYDYGYGFTAFVAKYANDFELGNQAWRLLRRWGRLWGRKRLLDNVKRAATARRRFPVHLIALEIFGGIMGYFAYERAVRRVASVAAYDRAHGQRPATEYALAPIDETEKPLQRSAA